MVCNKASKLGRQPTLGLEARFRLLRVAKHDVAPPFLTTLLVKECPDHQRMLANHSHTARLRQDEAELSDMLAWHVSCVASRLLPAAHGVGMPTDVVGHRL
jgi:hypothetical protein